MSPYFDDMFEAKYAYHVTDVMLEDGNRRPDFSILEWSPARNRYYDGTLVGLPSVWFTTTLRDRNLPLYSPYPSHGIPGKRYWRLRVPLNFIEEYDEIWMCRNGVRGQKHLILTKDDQGRHFENISSITPIHIHNNQYLCHNNGTWYTNEFEESGYFVNVAIVGAFYIKNYGICTELCAADCTDHCSWDTVIRGNQEPGNILDREELANVLLEQWAAKQQ